MKRRVVTAGLIALPFGAEAQGMTVRVGVLTGLDAEDPATKARLAAFRAGMVAAGWQEGRNLAIDVRFAPNSDALSRQYVAELLAAAPDVLVVQGPAVPAAQQATKTVPIVFLVNPDPLGAGIVSSLSRPGDNTTGFSSTEPSFATKWIELLKEVAPDVRRVAVMGRSGLDLFRSTFDGAAKHFGLEISYAKVQTQAEIEAAIATLASQPNGGLVLPTDAFIANLRKPIIALCRQHKLPLVTGNPPMPRDGGLLYYGADVIDLYRRSAAYVDRILKGARPGDLPVQQPVTFDLVINLRTASELGLTVPPALRARADEVIE
jgi:putative ABC transport system substrate-binding protein